MRTERSYAQLARVVETQAHAMADAMLELDTAMANLDTVPGTVTGRTADAVDVAVAAIARARARLHGDALHERNERRADG